MKFQISGIIDVHVDPSINPAYVLDAVWQAMEAMINSDELQGMMWDELADNEDVDEPEHISIATDEIFMRHIPETSTADAQ